LDACCAAQEARNIEARPPLPLFLLQLLVDCCFSATVTVAAATVAIAVVVNAITIAAVTIAIAAVGKRMTNKPLAPSPPPCFATLVCRNWVNCLCQDKKAPATVMLVLQ
jgi:hypothetical protein